VEAKRLFGTAVVPVGRVGSNVVLHVAQGVVKHKVEFARHPNGRDIVVECSCGLKITAHHRKDAMRVATQHIDAEAEKEKRATR
jgi:hypothetical protein